MKIFLTLLSLALALPAYSAETPAPARVRGTIASVAGDTITVKSGDGKNVDVQLGDKTTFTYMQPIPLSEIKSGDFIAVTSMKRSDGTLSAVDVRRMPKPVNPGHRPLDGRDDATMTNATVSAIVQSTSGREVTVSYEGGSQKILVPESSAVSMLVPGERSQLLTGAPVNLAAVTGTDGKLTAQNIQVGKPAVKP